MTHLETEIKQLKEAIMDMMKLSTKQLNKTYSALMELDTDLAQEVIHREVRLNGMELSIDRDCENMFALLTPVASDLRFVLAVLKMNSELERIGDHAVGMAKYVLANKVEFNKDLVEQIRLTDMFEIAISMTKDVRNGLKKEDTKLVRKVFTKDIELNEINRNSSKVIAEFVKDTPDLIQQSLYLFSIIRKLERVGDLSKNIAEQIIFYLEAEVVRHKEGEK